MGKKSPAELETILRGVLADPEIQRQAEGEDGRRMLEFARNMLREERPSDPN